MKQLPQSFPLPHPFPAGKAWAAIKHGVVVNMIYMQVPKDVSYSVYRQRSRATLARVGEVWSGKVERGYFIPDFESTDIRRNGDCNTARQAL